MFNPFAYPRDHEDGFTMMEILTVILIMGIMSAIAVPTFLVQRKMMNDRAVKDQVSILQSKVSTWHAHNPNGEIDPTLVEGMHVPDGMTLRIQPRVTADDLVGDYLITGWHENGFSYSSDDPYTYDSLDGTYSVSKVSV